MPLQSQQLKIQKVVECRSGESSVSPDSCEHPNAAVQKVSVKSVSQETTFPAFQTPCGRGSCTPFSYLGQAFKACLPCPITIFVWFCTLAFIFPLVY